MIRIRPGSRWFKALAIAAALFVAYVLLGFFAAPPLIRNAIVDFASEQLERKASVGAVRVNPLIFRVELKDVALSESDGRPIAGFGRLAVDFELSSLFRWAWTFSEIALEKPVLHADVGPDGRLNLAALLDKLPKTQRRPDARPPRLLLHKVALGGAKVVFSDRSDPTPASTTIEPISLELSDISTLPDHRGEYALKGRLADGGELNWRGTVSLDPLGSQGEIRIAGVRPLTAWRFLRDELGVAEPKGAFDVAARYRFAFTKDAPALTIEDARVTGSGIEIAATGAKEPLLALASIEAKGGRFDLVSREFSVGSVTVRDGAVSLDVDEEGSINLAKLVKTTAKPSGALSAGKPWKGKIEALQVEGMRLRYGDRSRARPIRVTAQDVSLKLAAALGVGGGSAQVALDGISVAVARPTLEFAESKERPIAFDSLAIEGGKFDLAARQLDLGRVAVKGGEIRVTRDKDGAIPFIEGLQGRDAGLVQRALGAAVKRAEAEGRPWRIALDSLEAGGTGLTLTDQGFGEPLTIEGREIEAKLGAFRSDGKDPVKFEASLRFAQGGSASASGAFRTSGESFTGRVRLERLNLKPLAPALASRVRATLVSGEVSMDAKAEYQAREGRHELRVSGPISVDNVLVNEQETGDRLLAWKKLATPGLSLSLAPNALRVAEATVSGLGAKITVFKDRSVNLAKALIEKSAAPAVEGAVPPKDDDKRAAADALFPVVIERVQVDNGTVNFSDLSLVLPFAADVTELGGTVQGIGTDRDSRATVRLEGRVNQYGLARVNGSLATFRPKSFLDLDVVFRNVEMPPLSPYTATFAGRRIASGRLALDLQYKINDGMLAGENKVVLQEFTLGERVESPDAKNLPLDLAVALLTDSEGKIDVSVPVSGNLNDPQFSYGHVIWQAIANLIGRIVTAPFRALGALFGGGGEKLDHIAFDPGGTALLPPEREKLKRLAEGLAKRPQLKLVAEGQFGPADRKAMQAREVERAVAAKLGHTSAAGKAPDPVNVTDAKTQRALEAIFVERSSDKALEQFAADAGQARGKPVSRASAALALVGRASADTAFYEALLKRLIETTPVADGALKQLATDRARVVGDYLKTTLAFPAARVETRTTTTPESERVRMGLEAAPAAKSSSGQ